MYPVEMELDPAVDGVLGGQVGLVRHPGPTSGATALRIAATGRRGERTALFLKPFQKHNNVYSPFDRPADDPGQHSQPAPAIPPELPHRTTRIPETRVRLDGGVLPTLHVSSTHSLFCPQTLGLYLVSCTGPDDSGVPVPADIRCVELPDRLVAPHQSPGRPLLAQ